jgi:hypothetical protein
MVTPDIATIAAGLSEAGKPGDWVVFDAGWTNASRYHAREVAKITPKLVMLERGGHPSQITRVGAIAFFPDREAANLACQTLSGIDGEYQRRRTAARRDFEARCALAAEAKGKAIRAYLQEQAK